MKVSSIFVLGLGIVASASTCSCQGYTSIVLTESASSTTTIVLPAWPTTTVTGYGGTATTPTPPTPPPVDTTPPYTTPITPTASVPPPGTGTIPPYNATSTGLPYGTTSPATVPTAAAGNLVLGSSSMGLVVFCVLGLLMV